MVERIVEAFLNYEYVHNMNMYLQLYFKFIIYISVNFYTRNQYKKREYSEQ